MARELQDSGRFDSLGLSPPNFDSSARGRGIDFAEESHVGRIIIIIILLVE